MSQYLIFESERLNVRNSTTSAILRCSACALHDQLASLGKHAQLTRCFSAVAELLVILTIRVNKIIFIAIHFFTTLATQIHVNNICSNRIKKVIKS